MNRLLSSPETGFMYIQADNICAAWEDAIEQLYFNPGWLTPTEYDKPDSPLSHCCNAKITITEPFGMWEPFIHKAIPCGVDDLVKYVMEVCDGLHADWQDNDDPQKWHYTYYSRLYHYGRERHSGVYTNTENEVNQINYIVDTLAENWYSRRAQAIIWEPAQDTKYAECPCLQRLWFMLEPTRLDGYYKLNCNAYMRSNDAFKASFMNMRAFTELQRIVAMRLSDNYGIKVSIGWYSHNVDNFHIYGEYLDEVKAFLENKDKRSFEDRCYYTSDLREIVEEVHEKYGVECEENK